MKLFFQKLKIKDKGIVILSTLSGLFTIYWFYLSLSCSYKIWEINNILKQKDLMNLWVGTELGALMLPLNILLGFTKLLLGSVDLLGVIIMPILVVISVIFFLLALFGIKLTKGIWKEKKWTLIIWLITTTIYFFFNTIIFFTNESTNFYAGAFSLIKLLFAAGVIFLILKLLKSKKLIIVFVALAMFLLLVIFSAELERLSPQKHKEYKSPDGKYTLIIYKVPLISTMPGQGSDHSAIVELRNKNNHLIDRLTHREDESIMLRDVGPIKWKNDKVWFAVGRYFYLN